MPPSQPQSGPARKSTEKSRPAKGGTSGKSSAKAPAKAGAAKRSRYTPPSPKKDAPSPLWVPVVMATLMLTGLVVIIANYLELLPGDGLNRYLLLGLGQITAGFMLATTYR